MSLSQTKNRIAIPASLVDQLYAFRKHVWTVKMLEAAGIALFSIFFGVLCVFALDRVFDSPAWIRAAVLLLTTVGVASIPYWFQKWVVRVRTAESVAKLLGKRMPAVGDALLGAIELSNSDSEQSRSPALCKAALVQVAEDSAKRNFLANGVTLSASSGITRAGGFINGRSKNMKKTHANATHAGVTMSIALIMGGQPIMTNLHDTIITN